MTRTHGGLWMGLKFTRVTRLTQDGIIQRIDHVESNNIVASVTPEHCYMSAMLLAEKITLTTVLRHLLISEYTLLESS